MIHCNIIVCLRAMENSPCFPETVGMGQQWQAGHWSCICLLTSSWIVLVLRPRPLDQPQTGREEVDILPILP